ncbi:heterokaryon incompatibility protein [Colletotrichum tofieldiae]|uniref:Heterokaryon incompatibility protein n=1 Tax=Colletotrichum tofieldiae TaxID=708197 RepID=A0A166W757_9PEZI|nr:heterokaryon incompatibility protein [Colletotrichum tofieldiae]GKT90006.1 heterokaryon incompatibility protein [Colletotrichum tofieldiae]
MHPIYRYLPQGDIRLLTLHPGDALATLSCTLQSTPLESAPDYEAVSYAWGSGDLSDTLTVFSNPDPTSDHASSSGGVAITPHVTALLRSLRRAAEPRVLWIDAICINQADISERSVQVLQMREIYTRALHVIIWLGLATEDGSSDLAFTFLKEMAMHRKYCGRHNWIGGQRLGSDTSSECGRGALVEASFDELDDEGHADDEDDQTAPDTSTDEDDTEATSRSSQAYPLDWDTDAHLGRVQQAELYRSKIDLARDLFQKWVDPIAWKLSDKYNYYIVSGYWNPLKRWRQNQAWEKARVAWDANNKASHIAFGYPILYQNEMDVFFQERYQDAWAAVDQLLYRQWWSRTWVVQEVWSASDKAILQCGQRTIKWKTFQKAMSYEEAWDDMGNTIKESKDARIGLWGQLKRRYGLAIHLCKMRLIDSKLSDLLWNTWDRDAQDPRDKVFAVLGLVSKNEGLLKPDYGKTTRRVFCEAARDIIRTEDSLDILLAAGGPRFGCDGGTLPSWVPDWRKEANEARPVLFVNRAHRLSPYVSNSMDMLVINEHGYSACGDEKAIAWFGNDIATLHTHAVLIDEVGSVGAPQGPGPATAGLIIDDACSMASAAFAGGTPSWWEKKQTDDLQGLVKSVLCAGAPGEKTDCEVIENVMPLRRFFVNQREKRLCIGPSSTRPGDKVFIVAGCNFPIILRETADPDGEMGMFELVGEAYVHGIMAGEAIEKMKTPTWWERLAWWLPPKEVKWCEIVIR